jgi:hypothetical protein
VRAAVFDGGREEHARWLIWEIARAVGVIPSSIHNYTWPTAECHVQCRRSTCADDVQHGAVDLPNGDRQKAGAFILESRVRDRVHRPAPRVRRWPRRCAKDSAARSSFRRHFQVNAKKYHDPEVDAVKALAREAIAAGSWHRHRYVDAGRHLLPTRRAAEAQQESASTF